MEKTIKKDSIVFIRVSMLEGKSKDAMKPLAAPILAVLTPVNYHFQFWDERVEKLPESFDASIIAFSVDTFCAKRAYYLAQKYRKEGVVIVMGGFHPSCVPEEAAQYCDCVLIGDAEDTWPQFLEGYEKNQLKQYYCCEKESTVPMAKYWKRMDIFSGKKYQKIGVVQFSRGCKFHCDFCSIKAMYPKGVKQREIQDIIEEIQYTKQKLLFFADDNLFFNKESAVQLFRALRPLKKKWACQISLDIALEDELLSLMAESGCILVLMGFESLNHENLRTMKKAANLQIDSYERAIKNLYQHGLMIYGTFVLGYDEDTEDSIYRTMEFAAKNCLAVANFNPLIPMPATPLYERFAAQGRLLYPKWWLKKDYRYADSVFLPKKMTPQQLQKGCKQVRFSFYSPTNILKRLIKNPLHRKPFSMIVFLALNIISAIEIRRKQGKPLGGSIYDTDADKAEYRKKRT